MPNIPGSNLSNIFVLRDYTDSQSIYSQLSLEKHVVVLGLSFIGMEAAAYCINKCASITVIGRDTVPLRAIFGADIGDRIRKEHEAKGIIYKVIMHSIMNYINLYSNNKFLIRGKVYFSKQYQTIYSKGK